MHASSSLVDRRTVLLGLGALAVEWPGLARAAAEPRDLARDAYVWGYPTVELYARLRGQVLDTSSPEFAGPLNSLAHTRDLARPGPKLLMAPNIDTPYSRVWLDLRAGPVVVTMPPFERERYLSLQLNDLYTWIIGYVSPRTNGTAGGDFMVVPPGWKGKTPHGIRGVFQSTTLLAHGLVRTQLLGPDDLDNVHALQDRMQVRTLAAYLGRKDSVPQPLPPPVPALRLREQPTDPAFFNVLNWMLPLMPALPEEADMRRGFETLGIGPGLAFAPDASLRQPVTEGMGLALQQMRARAKQVRSSAELYGSREFLKDDFLTRATGAMLGILGNAAEEFLGVGWAADANGQPFDGKRRYRVRFAAGQLPPVDAFWSISVYTQEKLLYANEIDRYVINMRMVPSLQKDDDGGITIHVQHESPGPDLESNWLPVPADPFVLTLRTYLPQEAIRKGLWTAPPVTPLP